VQICVKTKLCGKKVIEIVCRKKPLCLVAR